MDNFEVDSVADLVVDVDESAESVATPQMPAPVAGLNVVDPVMAEVAGTPAVVPQDDVADAGMHQAFVTDDGRVTEGFVPLRGAAAATAEPPVDVGAIPSHGVAERAAAQLTVLPYADLLAPAPGTSLVDHGRVTRRELRPFEFPRSPCQHAELLLTLARAGPVPATVSAQTCMTTMSHRP